MEEQTENLPEHAAESSTPAFKKWFNQAVNFIKSDRRARRILISLAIVLLLLFIFSVPVYFGPALQDSWGKNRA